MKCFRGSLVRSKLQKCVAAFALSFALTAVKAGADMPTGQFLLIGQGARAEAMGESVVANCMDETATYWNPAAMSYAPNPVVGFNSYSSADNINSSNIAFVIPFKRFSFGVRLLTMNSSIDNYDANGNLLSQSLAENDSSESLLVSYRLLDCLSLGLGIGNTKMIFTLPNNNNPGGSTSNTSLGILFKKDNLALGASFSNLGGELKFYGNSPSESLPQTLNIGGALSLLEKKNLTLSVALQSVANDSNAGGFRVGGEYLFNKYFALRAGIITIQNSDPEPTFGFGLNFGRFELDYADTLMTSNSGGSSENRIGLSVKFGKIVEVEEKKPEAAQPVSVAATNLAPAAPVTNIAVADFAGKNVSQADASIVADFLRTELVGTGKCNVVEKANMDKILAESAFQQSGCTTSECAVQIGKILNVKHMIVGSLSKLMDTYYITVNVVEVETSKIVASYDEEAMSSKELRAACKTLAQKLVNPEANK